VPCAARRHAQGSHGENPVPLGQRLSCKQVLFEVLQDRIDQLRADPAQARNGLGDLLDLIVGQEFHHLT
jgi:hypothetical protein